MSKKYPNESASIMVVSGCFTEDRTVSRIREHVPNRYGADAEARDLVDLIGYVSLEGKRVRVCSGYWGDVEIWKLDREAPDRPTCPACGAQLDIGSSMTWTCWPCFYKTHPRKEQMS